MEMIPKLPIGIEDFEDIRKQGFYYIDKTGLIKELLTNWGSVNLFTRPRRFGKSLNMSMLKHFFEYGEHAQLFEGLEISKETRLCEEYMGKFPVISVSLKGVSGLNFEQAKAMFRNIIGDEAARFYFLHNSDKLTSDEKQSYKQLTEIDKTNKTVYTMSDEALTNALKKLSELLYKHYGQKVVLLIDEYDVPLDKAYQYGYYNEMVNLIRNMFGGALKTNSSLQFAILTGCLRISKESIFTGLNNFKVLSIADVRFDEYFGFTDDEVKKLLEFYGLSDHYAIMKEWYDGYRFGRVDVYCPWDVINYADILRDDPRAQPQAYWANSSGNDIIKKFFKKATGGTVKSEIERLIAGESIKKDVHIDLTYNELDTSLENLWSVLFTTGYLTQAALPDGDTYTLRIPNLEVRKIFTKQIYTWFKEESAKDGERLNNFCDAIISGDAAEVEAQFNAYLGKTISIRDTFVKKQMKENFYHGILLGLVGFKDAWDVASNKESGEGYSDILIEDHEKEIGVIIEIKYPDSNDLEAGSKAALAQIETRQYDEMFRNNGSKTLIKYGIACHLKKCKVAVTIE